MYMGFFEEGDRCREPKCDGRFEFIRQGSCSCHINPPCSACTDAPLTCKECGHEPDQPEFKDVTIVPGLAMREYKPRPLDKTKISWRTKMHTHFTQICEGIYPEGATRADVQEKVKGTFGGRFEQFGNGKFKYVAYTD